MAYWVKCTGASGDTLFLNFDLAVSIHRNDARGITTVLIQGEDKGFEIQDTLVDLKSAGVSLP